jgi:hypothetical protein
VCCIRRRVCCRIKAAARRPARYRQCSRQSRPLVNPRLEYPMNEETFNLSIRKFLKMVGVNSQREIEQAVASAVADRRISGTESFPAIVTLKIAGLDIDVKFDGQIKLE